MAKDMSGRRSVATGLASAAAGAVALACITGGAAPAGATGAGADVDALLVGNLGCLEVAAGLGLGAHLGELEVSDLPADGESTDYVLDDGGTDDGGDDVVLTLSLHGSVVLWSTTSAALEAVLVTSSGWDSATLEHAEALAGPMVEGTLDDPVGAATSDAQSAVDAAQSPEDAVGLAGSEARSAVNAVASDVEAATTGRDTQEATGVYAGAGGEVTGEIDLAAYLDAFVSISFCHDGDDGDGDGEEPPVTEPPVTEPPTTEPPVTEPPTTAPEPTEPTETTDTADDTPSTVPASNEGELPRTGNNTMPLLVAGGGLLAGGTALVAGRRYMLRRS